ncbi:uncharacterized protein BYT42DRAFT_558901 [Radiomyces spectabilis]|uniref:uncharacterized protein n=1 Tax=Radiomyces spectabilis TaxID=64574 RepID=UPI00221F600C|nr:uncharacterized protein BYT42DRAFT_558901 [Radiomyces spectabilis]KAI8388092.1 hypothetical protein BYT42DRAFT_558901 [Radiomyces spectabilis]
MHRSLLRASRLSNASISRLIWRATPSLASRWSPVNSTLHVAEPRSSPLRSPSHRRSYTTEHSTVTLGSQPIVGECPGCGAPFQEQDPSKPGFLAEPKAEVVKKKKQSNKSMSDEEFFSTMLKLDPEIRAMLGDDPDADGVPVETKSQLEENEQVKEPRICHRCYTLRHHHQMTTETSPAFLRKTLQYGSLNFLTTKRNPLLIALFDIADMPSSLGPLPNLLRQNPTARVFLVANKVDMLPARARRHEQRIRDWIVQYVKQQGVSTRQIVHVSLVSAKKGWGVSGLMKRLFIERLPTDDVYMIGCTNVGKSALINYMMSQSPAASEKKSKAKLRSQYKITSSAAPGTTIGTIKIPLHALGLASSSQHEDDQDEAWKKRRFLARERFLIDTPGLINDNQLLHLLPFKEQKKLLSGGELKPITFRLEPGMCCFYIECKHWR